MRTPFQRINKSATAPRLGDTRFQTIRRFGSLFNVSQFAMNSKKEARVEKAKHEAASREAKALRSLALCLSRSDVMRVHHDDLVKELADTGAEFTDVKKARFNAYICFWFAVLQPSLSATKSYPKEALSQNHKNCLSF